MSKRQLSKCINSRDGPVSGIKKKLSEYRRNLGQKQKKTDTIYETNRCDLIKQHKCRIIISKVIRILISNRRRIGSSIAVSSCFPN